jgi:hypothetical protein
MKQILKLADMISLHSDSSDYKVLGKLKEVVPAF